MLVFVCCGGWFGFLCFRFDALAGLGAFVRAGFLCVSVLGVASGPGMGLAGCRGGLPPPPPPPPGGLLCRPFLGGGPCVGLALCCFVLRGGLLCVFPCVILCSCFSVLLVLRLPRLGKRELILVLFVRLFGLCLFRFVGFLFLLGSGKGCGL